MWAVSAALMGDRMKESKRTGTARWMEDHKYWRVTVRKDGEQKSFYSSTPGKKGQREANAKADRWLTVGVSPRGERVENLYPQWLEERKQVTSSTNWRPMESRWRNWVKPAIGKKRVDSLTEQDLQGIINAAYSAGRSKKVLQMLAADLRGFCKYCRKCRKTDFLPEDLTIPAGARYKGKKVLQLKDLITLFNVGTTVYKGKTVPDEFINAYRFQVLTGLRPGELLGLRWEDISGRTVHVRRAVNVDGEETQGKNQNAVRSFILSDMARRVLNDQKALTGGGPTVFDLGREEYYARRWKIYCTANGIEPVSPYELRHTFVSVVKRLPAGEVKPLVGHSQNMDTFGTYGHELEGEGESTAQAVNGLFEKLIKSGY